MKPSILLRLIASLVVVVAFVLGATVAEASNRLNLTALLWAQRQLPLLWIVDGFALLALLPIFGSAILQTRLSHKTEELTHLRGQHETQMEDMIRHSEETERANISQSKSMESLEETVSALAARLNAMEADNKAHQENMEAEARRLAVEAFSTLAGEVQANTRQMEAVSLAMQYQRAEIQQIRQNLRATQRSYDITETAQLSPPEIAALQGEAPPLMIAERQGGEDKEKRRRGEEETEEGKREKGKGESQSSIENRQLAIENFSTLNPQPSTGSAGFFEPTMNAQTTFVAPMTEFEITPSAFEEEEAEFTAAASYQAEAWEEFPSVEHFEAHDAENAPVKKSDTLHDAASSVREVAASGHAVTSQEYRFLHGTLNGVPLHQEDFDVPLKSAQALSEQPEPQQTELEQSEPPQVNEPRGLRRWFMRS